MKLLRFTSDLNQPWASEGSEGGEGEVEASPWILYFDVFLLKVLAKKVVFSVSSGWNEISPLLVPLENPFSYLWKNPQLPLPWKKSFRRPWNQISM